MGFGGFLRQSTAVDVLIGPFVDSGDGDSEETTLTISQGDVLLSKNGQTAAQKNDNTACAHDADGFYNCELDATDTNTVGQLTLYVHEAGALAVRHDYQVVEEAIYDALYAASANAFAGAAGSTTLTALADGSITAAKIASDAITAAKIADGAIDAATFAAGAITATVIASGAIDADAIAADAITAAKVAADVSAEIADAVLDEALSGHTTAGSLGKAVADIETNVAAILVDTGTTLDGKIDTIDTVVDAIKVQTDKLTFTVANQVDANIQSVNDASLTGDGNVTPWGPA